MPSRGILWDKEKIDETEDGMLSLEQTNKSSYVTLLTTIYQSGDEILYTVFDAYYFA